MLMEREDLLSTEYEEEAHKQRFKEKDWTLPQQFALSRHTELAPVASLSIRYEAPAKDLFSAYYGGVQLMTLAEENLAPRNSEKLCNEHLKSFAGA